MPLTLVRRAGGYERGSAGIAVTFLFGTTPSLGCVQGLVGRAAIGSEARVVAGATSAENGCRNDDGQENVSTHGKFLGWLHRRHARECASGDDTTTQWRTGRDYVTQTDWAGVQLCASCRRSHPRACGCGKCRVEAPV